MTYRVTNLRVLRIDRLFGRFGVFSPSSGGSSFESSSHQDSRLDSFYSSSISDTEIYFVRRRLMKSLIMVFGRKRLRT